MAYSGEQAPLLGSPEDQNLARNTENIQAKREAVAKRAATIRAIVYGALTLAFGVALVVMLFFWDKFGGAIGGLPKDPWKAALVIMDSAPVIDGHIDLPEFVRMRYRNNISAFDLTKPIPGHVDIPRLREGKVGGFFWSVYASCPHGDAAGEDFLNATWRVRDTLEQIDVAKLIIDQYPETFSLSLTSTDVKTAISRGKIASLLGIEGAHQIGNSIGALRQFYDLGARYLTLTHSCNNAFADSAGIFDTPEPKWGGLSPLGRVLIPEMNRIGMLVDISHTSDDTARQALKLSKAPVIWSHSSARAVHDVPRNVPDDILRLIGTGEGQTDAVVMVNFAPYFVAPPGEATLYSVADHIDHIGNVAGRKHVGLGSDYDGIEITPDGLEDVSKYPALIAELYKRGWSSYELSGLTGGNLLRILEGAERVKNELRGTPPAVDIYDKRTDL